MFCVKVHAPEQFTEEDLIPRMATTTVAEASTDGGAKGAPVGEKGAGPAGGGEPGHTRTVCFSSGNPRVESTRGVMHLYRNTTADPGSADQLPVGRSEHLCVLAVPTHMTGADFCQFTGSFMQNIEDMRIVRNDGVTDRYSVLMKFDKQSSADEFYRHYNGKPFSSLEAEVCHVLFTADVQYTDTAEEATLPPSGLTELPTCPVCLERLDQNISGILTTVCNHSFHSSCISKWTDSSCPVCRYCQQQSDKSTCSICDTSENLWICVICGFVGCGRYQEGHAINHWKETQHCYSLELETQCVWDYVGDNYVHRLIQSKTDGKLVELPAPCRDGSEDCSSCEAYSRSAEVDEALYDSKLEAIATEYDHLLTTQLESQRQYYEGLLEDAETRRDASISLAVEKAMSLKLQRMQQDMKKVQEEHEFLQQVNQSLVDNQKRWQQKFKEQEERERAAIKERDEKITDLEEQVRDFMIFIEAQKMLESSANAAELREGTILPLPANVSKPGRSSKLGRKKK
ncbi:BRCA1-associated protein [Marchantia polymorpha subsp. ruderalis]|uniref:BRCA1-associated protein n=2 Tax=Marchantia polymorpha TaxID=3197 RepID=A0AAF6AY35_MARPO|nr:hypothetical protein MARPO_0006s0136 [Marchantia polymorpha]BBN04669.1 hypothetical protein Mp_3g06680 [Marchantia polymorpha subsp. ruderalis]|eukprot:PTQ48106.1 hypothetical protein MARPO_0006s0136 [Marchantia polymorpha]